MRLCTEIQVLAQDLSQFAHGFLAATGASSKRFGTVVVFAIDKDTRRLRPTNQSVGDAPNFNSFRN